jgi:TolA-binding protein
MQKFIIIAAIALLSACTSVPPNTHNYNSVYTQKQELEKYSSKKSELQNKLLITKQQQEIDDLKAQIAELDKKISDLQSQIQDAENQQRTTSTGQSSSNQGINIGPRGGCYVYTSSGKKRYVSCN